MSSYEGEEIEEGKILLEGFFPPSGQMFVIFLLSGKAPAPSFSTTLPLPATTPCTLPGHQVTRQFLQMQGCYGDLLMLQLPCGKWVSRVSPSGLRDYSQMLQEQEAGSMWRLWVSILPLICSAGGQGGSWWKKPESTFQGQVRTPPGLCPAGMPLGDSHLVSGLGEGPIWTALWNLRPSADVSFLGGLTPSVSTASGPSRVFLAAVPKTASCAPGEIKQRVTSAFSLW